ncbi:MAG: 6-phosphogluconolactonase [bacterium]
MVILPKAAGHAMIRIYPDVETLSQEAARLFAEQARLAVEERGRFGAVLAGGGTPRRTYEMLARPPFRDGVPWEQVHLFWSDERCVPSDDSRSNERMVREALLDHVAMLRDHVHPMRCDTGDPREAAQRYEAEMRTFFERGPPRFDLVLLGLGEDGHTASLLPGQPALEEQVRWAAEAYDEKGGICRITLTPPVINRALLICFLVAGARKAEVLFEAVSVPASANLMPAHRIRPADGSLLWLADRAAAARLERSLSDPGTWLA